VLQFAPKNNKQQNRFRKIAVKITPAAENAIASKYAIRTMKGYYY
jgi:hypothetical protein